MVVWREIESTRQVTFTSQVILTSLFFFLDRRIERLLRRIDSFDSRNLKQNA